MSRSTPLGGLAGALGLEIPTVAAPMAGGPGTPELVVAAAAAGGIGFLAAGYKSAHQLAEQITQVRASTPRFGVNLFVPNPVPVDPAAYRDYLDLLRPWADRFGVELPERPLEDDDAWQEKHQLLVDNPVPVVSLTFGLPERESIASLQRAGSRVLQTVTSAAEALRAEAVGEAAFQAAQRAAAFIDMRRHRGLHPRMGATDVCPFVPLPGTPLSVCVQLAKEVGARIAGELRVPVYLYGAAAASEDRRNLADIRRGQYEGLEQMLADPRRQPDFGPARFHPTPPARTNRCPNAPTSCAP